MDTPIPTDLVERLRSRAEALNTFPMDVQAAQLLAEAATGVEHLQSQLTAAPKEGSYFVAMREASARIQHLEKVLADARHEVATYDYRTVHGLRMRRKWAEQLLERIDAALKTVEQGGE